MKQTTIFKEAQMMSAKTSGLMSIKIKSSLKEKDSPTERSIGKTFAKKRS
jgi:hypothetical protein